MIVDLLVYALLFIIMAVLVMVIVANFVDIAFSISGTSVYKKRANQLKRDMERKNNNTVETIERLTEPVVKNVFPVISKWLPSLSLEGQEQLRKDLALCGWDDTFTPQSMVATSVALKLFGIAVLPFVLIFCKGIAMIWGLVISLAAIFMLDYMFRGDIKNKTDALFSEFPDFIRIVSGYLSADISFVDSIRDSVQYVGEAWQPLLKQLVIDSETKSTMDALNTLKDTIDIFEVKEFISLVKLTLEQGGEVKEGFVMQAEKINNMRKNAMYIKIGKRKTMSTVLQFPLLLVNTVVVLIPTAVNMVTMF